MTKTMAEGMVIVIEINSSSEDQTVAVDSSGGADVDVHC